MSTQPYFFVSQRINKLQNFRQNKGSLSAITDQNTNARIYVRGDRVVAYGRVMEVMSIINSAGYIKVALVAQNPDD